MGSSEQHSDKTIFHDSLYCEEEQELADFEEEESGITSNHKEIDRNSFFPLFCLEQDLFWDDEELQSLFSKEKQTCIKSKINPLGRKQAVEWILRINSHYGFSPLTAILAVNYLDRFLSTLSFQKDKRPWMMQLAAVTCLSLAAKVEETHVPLLLDLQVEGTYYVFDAKTIQRMELLILSNLEWRMNPTTPISFLDHIIRRLGLKSYVHWEFLSSCENLLLSIIADPRFTAYLPSVMATATMLHVIHRFEAANASHYENQLLAVLKISKEDVRECYDLILEDGLRNNNHPMKRNLSQILNNSEGIMDSLFSSGGSMDSWEVASRVSSSSPILKKRRMEEKERRLATMSRVFVDVVSHAART